MSDVGVITVDQMAAAVSLVESYGVDGKVERLECIGKLQPSVMGAVVQLTRMGVDYALVDHAFHVVLVLYECFVRDVPSLPQISVEMFEEAMRNNAALLELLDKETPQGARHLQLVSVRSYPEQNVLAFVTGYLNEHGLTKFSRDNELVVRVCKAITDTFVEAKRQENQART